MGFYTTDKLAHSDGEKSGKTVKEVLDSFTDEQMNVIYVLFAQMMNMPEEDRKKLLKKEG